MDINQRTERLLANTTNVAERASIVVTAALQAKEDLEDALATQYQANMQVAQAAMVFSGAVETVRTMPEVVKAIDDASESEEAPISAIREYYESDLDISEPTDTLLTGIVYSALGAEAVPRLHEQRKIT